MRDRKKRPLDVTRPPTRAEIEERFNGRPHVVLLHDELCKAIEAGELNKVEPPEIATALVCLCVGYIASFQDSNWRKGIRETRYILNSVAKRRYVVTKTGVLDVETNKFVDPTTIN
jgi:hypothetical protein